MAETNGTGSRKVKMSAIGGALTAILGVVEAFTGVPIGSAVYLTLGGIFSSAMLGNGLEHIGQGMGRRPTSGREILDAVRARTETDS